MDRFKGITGIYKITNLTNNKKYIGQSRNIYKRWKQHTYRVQDEIVSTSRIRAAFKKYNLSLTVTKPGTYGNFKFEIIEECDETELLTKEKYWIKKITPEYNCSELTASKYYIGNYQNKEKKIWLQYHNYEAENGYPSNNILEEVDDTSIYESTHYISSKKRSILYTKGDTIFLIVGRKFNKKKLYFLWTKTIVEEIDFLEDEDLIYNAIGDQNFINPPQLLNDMEGFDELFSKTGHFGLGFSNIGMMEFSKVLEKLSSDYKCINDISYKEYISEFEALYNKCV